MNLLKIYIIKPRLKINWSSPRTLAITSALNSMGKDYAPIGHFAIEIQSSQSYQYGINHVLTGMERMNKIESKKIVLKNKLGLAGLLHSFAGALQTAKQSLEEINQAKKDGRLKIIQIDTQKENIQAMFNFLANWIDCGSYTVYGGAKQSHVGEGAGCADFALEFFKLATHQQAPLDWFAKIKIPKSLIGTHQQRVNFSKILCRGHWANSEEPSIEFQTLDSNKIWQWLADRNIKVGETYSWKNTTQDSSFSLEPFKFHYQTQKAPQDLWQQIKL